MSVGGDGAPGARAADRRRRLWGACAAAALIVVAMALAILGGTGGSGAAASPERPARLVDMEQIGEAESSLGHPLYWAGERGSAHLELTIDGSGNAYLRYLSAGVRTGDPRNDFLTVGTYPVAAAQEALRRTAAEGGTRLERLPNGAVVLPNPSSRGSVYLAYPGSELEIEVYDPKPGYSMGLIRSGAIVPVGSE